MAGVMSPAPRKILLYFDTSVLDPIAAQGAGGRVKKLLRERGGEAFASTQNLIEAWRIPDDTVRASLVRTIIQVSRGREEMPVMLQMVRGAVRQMRHRHPEWIRPDPDLRLEGRDLLRRREAWRQVKADAAYVPRGVLQAREFLKAAVAESRRRHSAHRALRRAGGKARNPPRIQALIDALREPEAFWRREQGLGWWDAVTTDDRRVADLRDWLVPYLVQERLDIESWMTFWLAELGDGAVAPLRVASLVDFFNRDGKADPGDWGDINHAAFAVGRDYLLTADRNFHLALLKVRAEPGVTMAAPLLVNRAAPDIFIEVKSVLGW
jgi:hypothetical protein